MLRKKALFLGVFTAFLLVISTAPAFSEEDIERGGAIIEPKTEADIQWLWGEVVNIDIEKSILQVKYLDYEADMEKEANIVVNDQTKYENVNSFTEIKPNDTLSIDYIITERGQNIAKNIVVEKPNALDSIEEVATPLNSVENQPQ